MYITPHTALRLLHVLAITSISDIIPTVLADNGVALLQATEEEGPWHEPRLEFDMFLANRANATREFPIPGPNISAPGSSSGPQTGSTTDGWSWSIAVAADMPLDNSSIAPKPNSEGPFYYTGLKVNFNAPPSLVTSNGGKNLTVDDDWEICLYAWDLNFGQHDLGEYPDKLRSDDGTCASVLTEECIADMKRAARPNQSQCSCQELPSCKTDGDAGKVFGNNCYASYYNASSIRRWSEGKHEMWAFGDAMVHHLGDNKAYDNFSSLAWPVMASIGDGKNDVMASLSCVRAADVNSGGRLGISWATLGMGLAVCMLML
ncbi:hypothetical protein F4808DRAFT_323068 [Astrocystis sublimbata]|nr:hypothetical protein F4808DRAFT_323068 [Astrocystis sublimbata]